MNQSYHVVRLMKNQLYPTYQLHAYMANKKTAPRDGLRLAALTTMQWLRMRLGEHAPDQFLQLPDPDSYSDVDDSCLFSIHINAGYVIDIVSLPEQGLWSMQITEPDLGSEPGNPEQRRPPVPGRVIETNVAFKIIGRDLECGFQTLVSDPEGTGDIAEVYRLAIIRKLMYDPNFGLKQIIPIQHLADRIRTVDQIRTCQTLLHNGEAHLPLVIFTQIREEKALLPPEVIPSAAPFRAVPLPPLHGLPVNLPQKESITVSDPPYDISSFARSQGAYCRTYLLEEQMRERFNRDMNCTLAPGDIAVFEPAQFGGGVQIYPFKPSKARQEETISSLRAAMFQYPRMKQVSFGRIAFLSAARENLMHITRESVAQAATLSDAWTQRLQLLETQWTAELKEKNVEIEDLKDQLSRQKQYAARLEEEKDLLRSRCTDTVTDLEAVIADKDEQIAYLHRKLTRPKAHSEISQWVESTFPHRLILHERAAALLEEKSARSIRIELICDALDFLATDYWDRRYARISTDEMLNRCSRKYHRPFEVKPTGKTTIDYTPSEYKIKHHRDRNGKPMDSDLDYHLGVGNDPENLLRIYFLHDDEKQCIVVGSLPHHLRAVTIK